MYFKLELINREECYNKIFARSPNVGVMQAIKVSPPMYQIDGSIPFEYPVATSLPPATK